MTSTTSCTCWPPVKRKAITATSRASPARAGRALAEGFVYQGEPSAFEDGKPRGERSAQLPPGSFVNFLQNHDQVGNRAMGERLGALARPERLRALHAVLLLAPSPPCCSWARNTARRSPSPRRCRPPPTPCATAGARSSALSRVPGSAANRERIPDPLSQATFESAKLGWDDLRASRMPSGSPGIAGSWRCDMRRSRHGCRRSGPGAHMKLSATAR